MLATDTDILSEAERWRRDGRGVALATVVAYSRVHTGVHFPGDVLVGSLLGVSIAQITLRARKWRGS